MPAEEKEKIMQVGDISPVVLLCMCIVYNVCRYCRLENFCGGKYSWMLHCNVLAKQFMD